MQVGPQRREKERSPGRAVTPGSGQGAHAAREARQQPTGPLGRADLQVPLTLHSIWLDSTRSNRPDYWVDVRAELEERAATWQLEPEVLSTLRRDVLEPYESALR